MRKWHMYILSVFVILFLTACSAGKDSTEKLRDVEFTVMNPDDVPEELKKLIEEEKEEPFRLTYADKGYLYIAQGYGKKDTSGYSVQVEKCYETENTVCIGTNLQGPPKEEEPVEKNTYPYVVIKTEYIEKNVVFD